MIGTALQCHEQARGLQVDARTDIIQARWFALRNDRGPAAVRGIEYHEILAAILSDKEPLRWRGIGRQVRPSLERIVGRALAKIETRDTRQSRTSP